LIKAFQIHERILIQEKSRSSISFCSEHNDQERLFCITCQKSICLYCHNFGTHKGHNADLSQNLTNKTKSELEKLLQNIKEDNKKLEEMSTHLGTTIQNFNRDFERMTREINAQTDQLNLLVQKRRTELINLVEEHIKTKKVPFHQNQQIIGDIFAQGVVLKEEMILLLKKDDSTILHSANSLQQKTETYLKKSNDSRKNVGTTPLSIKMKFDSRNCELAIQNFGVPIDQEKERVEEQMRQQERRRVEEQRQQMQRQEEERKRTEEMMQQDWTTCQKCLQNDVVGRFHVHGNRWRFKDNKWQIVSI